MFCVICVPQTIKLSFREAVAGASRNGDRHSAEDCQKFGANQSFSLQHLHPLQMTDDSFAKWEKRGKKKVWLTVIYYIYIYIYNILNYLTFFFLSEKLSQNPLFINCHLSSVRGVRSGNVRIFGRKRGKVCTVENKCLPLQPKLGFRHNPPKH